MKKRRAKMMTMIDISRGDSGQERKAGKKEAEVAVIQAMAKSRNKIQSK